MAPLAVRVVSARAHARQIRQSRVAVESTLPARLWLSANRVSTRKNLDFFCAVPEDIPVSDTVNPEGMYVHSLVIETLSAFDAMAAEASVANSFYPFRSTS
jgi:hypothetical protein